MLQLQHIHKEYTTGDFTQVALDDVSVSFRDNEFVAILGPSGSGKTTMLNIVGGLDHYDTGDLIIDGISTKQYKDRDWDTFRNNRVGFVFQSYNLIPHQTILANVELALTLSGVSRDERRERARVALAQVGLADHVNKKPSQLSGGQMQRVAIARALINDPEILLADEPTGALDSKTSVQIMDLLTEIARDRLVVMVTHNPELAEQYATRIVNLADGVIVSDSDPFEPGPEDMRLSSKQVRRTSMSFLTALSLSFNNLMTKKGRTIMTAFAGSIGIIGIAAILALANGVNNYIKSVEEETLSVYPLQIMSTGLDMTSMMVSNMAGGDDGAGAEGEGGADEGASAGEGAAADGGSADGSIGETPMITRMLSSIASNDLASLKSYLDSGESGIEQHTSSIDYGYNVTPQIFDADTSSGVRQVNPDTSFSSMGMGSSAYAGNSLMSMSMSTDMFAEMMGNSSIVEGQYDVVAGHWPERYNECVLVLTANGNISDFLSYVLGLRDPEELKGMVDQFMNEEEVVVDLEDIDITYDDILAMRFKLVNAADFYRYDADYDVWVDKSDDDAFMTELVNGGEDLVISGIVQPRPEATATALSSGIFYTPELTRHLIEQAAATQIVQDQLADPDVDVFNGKTFAEEEEGEGESGFDMNSMFSVDESALQSAFRIDESKLSAGMSDMSLDLSGVSIDPTSLPPFDTSSIKIDPSAGLDLSNLKLDLSGLDLKVNSDAVKVDTAKLSASLGKVMQGFMSWIAANKDQYHGDYETALSDYLATQQDVIQAAVAGSIDLSGLQADLAAQLQTQLQDLVSAQLQAQLVPAIQQAITTQLQAQLQTAVQAYLQNAMTVMMTSMASTLEQQVGTAMERSMAQLSANMATAMSIDADAFANAFQLNLSEEELTELIMSTMTTEEHSFDNNLAKLGYANLDKPSSIDIYPVDFESKQEIISILDAYNDRMKAEGAEDKAITYTDIVGTLMNSVTTIIDMISYVLIAFVAISLVVSSIMIGVITYISVLERKKEIGILRAIGASKGDISRVFNAETIIEGLVSGLLGVGITALGCIPASAIVLALFDVPDVAQLPWQAAAVLVLISVFLTFVAGLLPSRSASRKDPVEALRSE
ncbi:ATP-binding cassette domain-containing protein [Adlercreutzia sp. ZJ242]|uniref:ATP-binding cassette domain-containing protein n=1 Tax=Adlercreutzia sp. ZJ242 TaxID=2709409 RepID=UPI0013EC7AD0|nr:ATP-binding cassette domain-containing protein [Adlercreutzia sp. ZJ242]